MVIKICDINKFLLFSFPIFFALPDMAINMGPLNLRYDDIIVYFLFFINIKNIGKLFSFLINNIFYKIMLILILYALVSILVVILIQNTDLLRSYNLFKSIGSIPYFIVLPYLFSKKENRYMFYYGAFFAGIIYVLSIYSNYTTIMQQSLFQQGSSSSFKRHISFGTLNPNAVASFAAILGWINILGFFEHKKKIVLVMAFILMFVPIFIFARGMSFGLIAGFIFLVISSRLKIKNILILFFIMIIVFISIISFVDTQLLTVATKIDISSGEGFHGRFLLWNQALELIGKSPIFGHGLSTEGALYVKYFSGALSHDLYLHYMIELGFIGFSMFLIAVIYLLYNKYLLSKRKKEFLYRVQMAVLISFLVADISGQLLYLNKYAFLIYVLVTFNLDKKEKYVQKL